MNIIQYICYHRQYFCF